MKKSLSVLVILGLSFLLVGVMAPPAFADWSVDCMTIDCMVAETTRCESSGGVMVWGPPDPNTGKTHGTCVEVPDRIPDPEPFCVEQNVCYPPPPLVIPIPATLTIESTTPVATVNSETYVSIVGGVSASESYEFETHEPDAERFSLVVGFYDTVGIGATVTVTSDGASYETETPN